MPQMAQATWRQTRALNSDVLEGSSNLFIRKWYMEICSMAIDQLNRVFSLSHVTIDNTRKQVIVQQTLYYKKQPWGLN